MTGRGVDVDVVVVGAGFAGLSAARHLVDAGQEVTVLEARDRVGGRTHTQEVAGHPVDLGGQWLGPGQDRIAALIEELGFTTVAQRTDGDAVLLDERGATRAAGEAAFALPPETLGAYLEVQAALDALAETIPTDAPWSAPGAAALDAITFATWVDARTDDPAARQLVELIVHAVFAADPGAISALHVAFYVASAGGWSKLVDSDGGAQQDRVVGGMQPVAAALAQRLGDRVRLDHPVTELIHDGPGSGDGVVARGPWGQLRARRAIVAVPPALASRIAYDPPLPADRDQLTQRMPAGSVIKVQVVYDRPWWLDDGLNGQILALGGSIGVTFDGSPTDDGPGIITCFLEGRNAVAARAMAAEDRRRMVLDHLVAGLGAAAAEPTGYAELDWSAEPWTRGCYGAHLPPGAWTTQGHVLRAPVGRIHWAGTETAEAWMGYIDGAIRSGERAAAEVLAAP
jgi:monoamine oxidase